MPILDVTGPVQKLSRAHDHVKNLGLEIRAFHKTHALKVIAQNDTETGKQHFVLFGIGQFPEHWPCLIGDCVHNLRSALDLLACALVRANNKQPGIRTYFPVGDDEADLEKRIKSKFGRASARAKDVVRTLKTYKGGNESLWTVHRLDILDKHQLVVPIATVPHTLKLSTPDDVKGGRIEMPQDGMLHGFKDGDIFLSAPIGMLEGYPEAAFKIMFGQIEVAAGERIVPTLNGCFEAVHEVIRTFDDGSDWADGV